MSVLPHTIKQMLPRIYAETGSDKPRLEARKGYNVLFIFADRENEWNVSQWRALTPSNAMNRAEGWFGKLYHTHGFADFLNPVLQYYAHKSDVIIFQRNVLQEKIIDGMKYWQGLGKPVLVDLDDGYQFLPFSNPARKFWMEAEVPVTGEEPQPGGALKMLERGLRQANGLISPNRNLLADWSYVTRNSYYLQNYGETEWWQNIPDRAAAKKALKLDITDKIVIGWGGSLSHYDSFWGSGIMEASKYISQRNPNVVWMICGGDQRITAHLPVPEDQKRHQQGVSPQQWPSVVRAFDIGVAPLFGPYDQRRSWIKGIEYLMAGCPWVGTHGETYRLLEGLGALGPESTDFWVRAIQHQIDHLETLQKFHEDQRQDAIEAFCIDSQLGVYAAMIEQIKLDFDYANSAVLPGVVKTLGRVVNETAE